MERKKELSVEDWKELGHKAKMINKCYTEMLEIFNVLPNNQYLPIFNSAYYSAGKLINHLDNMYECRFGNQPDFIHGMFIGKPE